MYSKKFKYILVDEYQDKTLFVQWLKYLAEHIKTFVAGDDDHLFIVGEELIKNFLNLKKCMKIQTITENYRSTQNILNVASNIIENNQNRVGKTFTDQEVGELVTLNCFRNVKDDKQKLVLILKI